MKSHILTPPVAQPGAAPSQAATGRTLNWGVVATGRIVAKVLGDLQALEDANVCAVSSRDVVKARAFADEYGIERAYGSYQELLADAQLDAVYIATPHGQHFEIAMAALAAGKHVVCEKSLTINAAEARTLVNFAGERSLFLMEALWARFTPAFARALAIIESGELGEISWVQADLGFLAQYDPAWRLFDPKAGGGALLDLAVYPLTWAVGALGFPDSVQAVAQLNADGVDTQTAINLGYAAGGHAQLMVTLTGNAPQQARVVGSAGWLATNTPLHNASQLIVHPTDGPARVEEFEAVGENYGYEFREATRCIQQGLTASPTMPWEHSVKTMELFDTIRASVGVRYPNDLLTH